MPCGFCKQHKPNSIKSNQHRPTPYFRHQRRHQRQPRHLGQHLSRTTHTLTLPQYHTLIWTGVKSAASDVNYIIEARSTDINSGGPLASGWFQVATGTITGAANSWFRVVITAPDGLYFDQYRIRVQVASGTNTITCKVVGVRR
ncbi:MAG: hypothetical protein KatS3mg087_1527 [Patescibacteria group bacterium]|nr:MAG: hypothetical protein KatS3mg087_1527 [Patescibacteria group bacterium]